MCVGRGGGVTEWVPWGIPATLCGWHRDRGDEATWLMASALERDVRFLVPDAQGFLSPTSALVRAAGPGSHSSTCSFSARALLPRAGPLFTVHL